MINFNVGGVVSRIWQADSILGIVAGDAVTGSFQVDLDAAGGPFGDGTFAQYSNAVDQLELSVGGVNFAQEGPSGGVFIRNNSIPPSFNYDTFELTGLALRGGGQIAYSHLNIVDSGGTMFSDLSLGNARTLTLNGHSSNFILSFFDLPAPPG